MRHISDYEFEWDENKDKIIFKETNEFTNKESMKDEECDDKISEHKSYLGDVFKTKNVKAEKICSPEKQKCKYEFIVESEVDKMIGMIHLVSYLSQLLSFGDEEVATNVLRKNINMIESDEEPINNNKENDEDIRYIR